MDSIGSWWVANLAAEPDEAVRSSFYANRLRRDRRPLGGKLYVTDRRLVFCPHLIDALFGGTPTAYDLGDIDVAEAVDPAAREDDPYGGGRTTRLGVELRDGSHAYFVLEELDAAIEAILTAIEADAAGHGTAERDVDL